MVLVDSSVWIAAWRGTDGHLVKTLTLLVESAEAAINSLIRTEILQGARDKAHQKKLRDLLSPVRVDSLSDDVWEAAPIYFLEWREKGITLTTVDCLIATHSLEKSLPLWSLDEVFHKIPKLRLFP